jgi:thiamine-monophosphate kinase
VSWNEDSLHRWLRSRLDASELAAGFGNDAAALARGLHRPVVCTDHTVEGVHYDAGTPARLAGHKACARALSDLAASAARPRAVLVALRAPLATDEGEIRALLSAIDRTARAYGAGLAGGDLCCAEGPLGIAVCAIGERPARIPAIARHRARPGDSLVITGPVGGSRLGRHLRFQPRIEAGVWLARCGARAMMDISDGLARDLARLAEASGVRIELEHVPIHRDARRAARASGRTALEHALSDGEDHELVAALRPPALARAIEGAPQLCPSLAVIGHVLEGSALAVPAAEGSAKLIEWTGRGGWVHGA